MTKKFNCIDANNIFLKEFYIHPTPELLEEALKSYNEENSIWVFDGKNSRSQRQAFFPEYKIRAKDQDTSQDTLDMYREKDRFKDEILPSWGAIVLDFDNWEADDIIYNLVKFLDVVKVRTTDKDFWQMLKFNPNLVLPETNPLETHWKDVVLYKALVGDRSDNIKGLKGFGNTSWKKLDPVQVEILTKAFEEDSDSAPDIGDTRLNIKFADSWEQLKVYYRAVKFIELTETEFSEMVVSRLNL